MDHFVLVISKLRTFDFESTISERKEISLLLNKYIQMLGLKYSNLYSSLQLKRKSILC
jgi:hypothetical protein